MFRAFLLRKWPAWKAVHDDLSDLGILCSILSGIALLIQYLGGDGARIVLNWLPVTLWAVAAFGLFMLLINNILEIIMYIAMRVYELAAEHGLLSVASSDSHFVPTQSRDFGVSEDMFKGSHGLFQWLAPPHSKPAPEYNQNANKAQLVPWLTLASAPPLHRGSNLSDFAWMSKIPRYTAPASVQYPTASENDEYWDTDTDQVDTEPVQYTDLSDDDAWNQSGPAPDCGGGPIFTAG